MYAEYVYFKQALYEFTCKGASKGDLYIFCVRREPSELGGEKIFRQPALRALNKKSRAELILCEEFLEVPLKQ